MKTVSTETLRELTGYDTCSVANAIEHFQVRTRNEGFMRGTVRCMYPDKAPVAGYAVTATVRTSSTPMIGRCYYDRPDFWEYVQSIPAPRFLVMQDTDASPGLGALFGEIHARIAVALSCVAHATNGAVRDLPGVFASGLQMYAGSVAVSHAYAHVVNFGEVVEVAGLQVAPGDLLHGDQHGVVSIPFEIAQQVPAAAAKLLRLEKELVEFCASPKFSPARLKDYTSGGTGAGTSQEPVK